MATTEQMPDKTDDNPLGRYLAEFLDIHSRLEVMMRQIATGQIVVGDRDAHKLVDDACEMLARLSHTIVQLHDAGYRVPRSPAKLSHKQRMAKLEERAALRNELIRAEIAQRTGFDDGPREDDGFMEALRATAAEVWSEDEKTNS